MIETETVASSEYAQPGWREVAIGLSIFAIVGFGGAIALRGLDLDPTICGLSLAGLSGVAGLAGFAGAFTRLRSFRAFGVRATTARWLGVGLGVGLLAFLVKGLFVMAFITLTGQQDNPQAVYAAGGASGLGAAILATLLLGVLTPIGEEFLFRGVVTTALLRHGPVVGVVGGATIFALLHGLNMVLPAAVVAGLAAGEVFRRSGSIWPAVAVHVMFNLPTIPVLLLASAGR